MQIVALIILGVCAIFLLYQDLKSRMVSWFLFPLIMICGITYSTTSLTISIDEFIRNTFINLLFLGSQFVALKAVFFIRKGKIREIVGQLIGWGDIVFLICCCVFFSPINFIVFYCLSLVFILSAHFLLRIGNSRYRNAETVPMAGLQAIFLFIYAICGEFMNINLSVDNWILIHMMN